MTTVAAAEGLRSNLLAYMVYTPALPIMAYIIDWQLYCCWADACVWGDEACSWLM